MIDLEQFQNFSLEDKKKYIWDIRSQYYGSEQDGTFIQILEHEQLNMFVQLLYSHDIQQREHLWDNIITTISQSQYKIEQINQQARHIILEFRQKSSLEQDETDLLQLEEDMKAS